MPFTVFGFGSLVNRKTLPDVLDAQPATVRGWRRAWRAPGHFGHGKGVCSLSVVPAQASIDGLMVTFSDEHQERMAQRERNYDTIALPDHPGAYIYRAKPAIERWGDENNPISLSYLDTVLGGFLEEFGEEGAHRFMETTDGWFVPILDDRAAPLYPRATPLTVEQCAAVDALLRGVDAAVTTPSDIGSA